MPPSGGFFIGKPMDRKQFIQKLKECDFEEFVYGSKADFVTKDESGYAWIIDRVRYNPENTIPDAIEDIEERNLFPEVAEPVYGIIRYKKLKTLMPQTKFSNGGFLFGR